jgi:hypothetical protein
MVIDKHGLLLQKPYRIQYEKWPAGNGLVQNEILETLSTGSDS